MIFKKVFKVPYQYSFALILQIAWISLHCLTAQRKCNFDNKEECTPDVQTEGLEHLSSFQEMNENQWLPNGRVKSLKLHIMRLKMVSKI